MIAKKVLEQELATFQKRFAGFDWKIHDRFIAGFDDDQRESNIMVLRGWGLKNLATEEGIEFLCQSARIEFLRQAARK